MLVIKVIRNSRLTHTYFFCFKNFVKMQKAKSDTIKKYQLSYFLNEISKLKCNTSKILNFHVVLKIRRNRILTHTNFYFLKIFFKVVKTNIWKKTIILFSKKCQNWSITWAKYSVFMLVIKILCNRRLIHTNFYFYKIS